MVVYCCPVWGSKRGRAENNLDSHYQPVPDAGRRKCHHGNGNHQPVSCETDAGLSADQVLTLCTCMLSELRYSMLRLEECEPTPISSGGGKITRSQAQCWQHGLYRTQVWTHTEAQYGKNGVPTWIGRKPFLLQTGPTLGMSKYSTCEHEHCVPSTGLTTILIFYISKMT